MPGRIHKAHLNGRQLFSLLRSTYPFTVAIEYIRDAQQSQYLPRARDRNLHLGAVSR